MSRVCGDCTLCCTLLAVKELDKPSHKTCEHCDKGCSIYHRRPQSCKDFECLWLQEDDMPAELRPDRSHVVLWVTSNGQILIASVDPEYPLAYKQGEMGRLLQTMLAVNDAHVGIIVGKNRFPLEPDLSMMSFVSEEGGEDTDKGEGGNSQPSLSPEGVALKMYWDNTLINAKPVYLGDDPEILKKENQ
jgi:uncharacterized protein